MDTHAFVPKASLALEDSRLSYLFLRCLSRIPKSGSPIRLDTQIMIRKRGTLPGVVGLTKFTVSGYASQGGRAEPSGLHTITFYTGLMSRLSDDAIVAVMAHELAHAWLNEHVGPEASKQREEDADLLAEMWGFAPELAALSAETEPLRAE